MNNYNQTTPQEQSKRLQPQLDLNDLHRQQAAVVTPIEIAVITGFLFSLVIGMSLWLFEVRFGLMVKITGFAGALITLLVWAALVFRWIDLTKLERWLGDLNNDGYIGEPPKKISITVSRVNPENQHVEEMEYNLPVSDAQVSRFFTTVKTSTRGGKGISRRQWTPKNVHGFSEGEWNAFYAELVRQQLVMIRGNECILTPEGESIADGWYTRAHADASPPPLEEDVEN